MNETPSLNMETDKDGARIEVPDGLLAVAAGVVRVLAQQIDGLAIGQKIRAIRQ